MDFATLVAGIITILGIWYSLQRMYNVGKKEKYEKMTATFKKDVVYLFISSRWSQSPNLNPRAVEVETFLRMTKIPYIAIQTLDSRFSPNGQLPYIVYNKETKAGAREIVDFLIAKLKLKIETKLPVEKLIISTATANLVRCNFTLLDSAIHCHHRPLMVKYLTAELRAPGWAAQLMSLYSSWRIGQRAAALLELVGTGSTGNAAGAEEAELLKCVQCIEGQLQASGGPFFHGSQPSAIDTTCWALLSQMVQLVNYGVQGGAFEYVATSSDVLSQYIKLGLTTFYKDMEKVLDKKGKQEFLMLD